MAHPLKGGGYDGVEPSPPRTVAASAPTSRPKTMVELDIPETAAERVALEDANRECQCPKCGRLHRKLANNPPECIAGPSLLRPAMKLPPSRPDTVAAALGDATAREFALTMMRDMHIEHRIRLVEALIAAETERGQSDMIRWLAACGDDERADEMAREFLGKGLMQILKAAAIRERKP